MNDLQNESIEYRERQLKEIVKDLHEGSDIRAVQRRFANLIRNVSPEEIAQLEQSLIAEGVPVEQVQRVCDVHVAVFEDALKRGKESKVLPGHPVHTFIEENKALRRIIKRMRRLVRKVSRGAQWEEFGTLLEQLKQVETHYRRKENQLFPYLEQVNFTGPSKVMWGKHDEIRAQLKEVKDAFEQQRSDRLAATIPGLLRSMRRMIFMEEKILFPAAMRKLSDGQWAQIRQGEDEIGYAWIEPGNLWDPSVVIAANLAKNLGKSLEDASGVDQTAALTTARAPDRAAQKTGEIALDVGDLLPQQINLMLKNLPVDITYVDEHDRVRYYSQGRERIFPRSPAVIGRAVQNCHPPASVHIVEKIVESFKSKEKDSAEFWLTLNDRCIHIRYFALYDEEGNYTGVLEVSQDVTGIRELKGEKRLLDW